MEGKPIVHKGFRTVADYTDIDPEDAPIDVLKEIENLTQFRKMGSLQQAPGHSVWKARSAMPNTDDLSDMTNYELVDFFNFSIDRDAQEITMLIYKHDTSGATKMFIRPYWNPLPGYTNYCFLENAGEWIDEWLELTEYYVVDISVVPPPPYVVVTSVTVLPDKCKNTGYFDGWFVLFPPPIEAQGQIETETFNALNPYRKVGVGVVTHGHVYAAPTHTFTLAGGLRIAPFTVWDKMILTRFPVRHLYKMDTEKPSIYDYERSVFDALPTQFIPAQNELRMPCGKDNRPLLLTMIKERQYFLGHRSSKYDGFWFDFQTPPQCQNGSAFTSFTSAAGGTLQTVYLDDNFELQAAAPVVGDYLSLLRASGTGKLSCIITNQSQLANYPAAKIYEVANFSIKTEVRENGDTTILIYNGTGAPVNVNESHLKTGWNQMKNPLYPMYRADTGAGGPPNTNLDCPNVTRIETEVQVSSGQFWGVEAAGTRIVKNRFLGTTIRTADAEEPVTNPYSVPRNPTIVNVILDNRSAVMIGHGTHCPSQDGEGNYWETQICFNYWFNRRITGFAWFMKNYDNVDVGPEGMNASPLVVTQDKYPYWAWNPEVEINDIPLYEVFDIYDFKKRTKYGGELPYGMIDNVDATRGLNAYTCDSSGATAFRNEENEWYVVFSSEGFDNTKDDGIGFKYISECNRYLDQDVTMNYTKGIFLGQTNGRYFIIGCKNSIEVPELDNADIIFGNLYAAGVSQYDIFLRDRALPIYMGDKDTIKNIDTFGGYLVLAKGTNVYFLDVNTDDELKYRAADTKTGRGTDFPDGMCQTPHGIVMPSSDSVWLIRPGGIEALMTLRNGPLSLYKSLISNSNAIVNSIFYNLFDELLLFIGEEQKEGVLTTYVLVYNFFANGWTIYKYEGNTTTPTGVIPMKLRLKSDKGVCILNWGNTSKFCLLELDESAKTFRDIDGNTVDIISQWRLHPLPYLGKHYDISQLTGLQLNMDAETAAARKYTLTYYADQVAGKSEIKEINEGSLVRSKNYNCMPPLMTEFEALSVEGGNPNVASVSQPFLTQTINSIVLWLTKQEKRQHLL